MCKDLLSSVVETDFFELIKSNFWATFSWNEFGQLLKIFGATFERYPSNLLKAYRQWPVFLTVTVWDKYLNHNPQQQSLFLHCEYCNPSHWLRYEVRGEVLLSNALRQKNDLKRNRVGELQNIQVTVVHSMHFVLSTELLMWICHRKEILKPIFLASALRQSESRNCGLGVVLVYRKMEPR